MPSDDAKGFKEQALILMGPCIVCGLQQLAGGDPTFYCVEVTRAGFDRRAVERRVGLQMQMGSGPLAHLMGPDEDIAKVIQPPTTVFVHERCGRKGVADILALIPEKDGG